MDTIEITFDNHEVVELAKRFPGALARGIQLTALDVHANVRKESPIDKGRLASSWMLQKVDELVWAINSNTKYRWYVQTGTPPHEIRPKNAQALHFTVGGEDVFCKFVNHPGTEANPYITRALEATERRIPMIAEKVVKEATSGAK